MRSPIGCSQLCPDCPLVPDGVTAELTELSMLTEDEMREYKYGGRGPSSGHMADEVLSETLRATFTVTESDNSYIDVGDTAEELVRTYGRTHQQVRDSFAECTTPVDKPGPIARRMGKTATCGGIKAPWM